MKIACENITYQYPGAPELVFNALSFSLKEPGFDALFGPSGIGKTSLAKIIINHIPDYSGSIHTHGMQSLLYTYNLERLPGWASVGKHLEKVTPPGR
nr:ATP-binding cassette domain-containing protein [Deltaproteobacteria bacterium]